MKTPLLFDLAHTPLQRGTTLIEASAGTGKTFTIAGLVLRLVIEHDVPIQQILVTTYTVPATAELRDRIRCRLRDALRAFEQNATDDEFLQALLVRQQAARTEVCRRLDFALRNFDEAPIFSIHGFCHRMLGDKAFESSVLFDAELVPDQKPVRREIAEDFWRTQFYEGEPIFSAIALRQNIKLSLFLDLLAKQANHPTIATIPAPKKPWAELKSELAEIFRQLQRCWREQSDDIRAFFAAGKNGWIKGSFTQGKPEKMAELLAALDQCFGETISAPETLSHLEKLTTAALQKIVKSGFAAPAHPFFDLCEQFLAAEADYWLGLQLEFIRWSADELTKRKIARNMLSFDDLQMRLAKALQAPGGSELARNIRTRFAAALIDEFQDTDPVQYEIFRRVYQNQDAWLFFIGDPKQAIYGFRGADVFTYMTAADEAKAKFTLGTNWRSESGLVRAVNHLFSQHDHPFLFEEIKFHPVETAGKEECRRLAVGGGKRESPDAPADGQSAALCSSPFQLWLCNEPETLSKLAATEKIVAATGAEIARLLGGATLIGDQKIRPQDIAVLVATHQQAALIQRALLPLSIPSVLQSHESVFHSAEATELLRLLQALAEPTREALLRTALALDVLGWRGEEIERLSHDELAWENWLLRFQDYHAEWRDAGFIQMFRRWLTQEKVRTRLLIFPNGERRLTNLLHLSELLHQACVERRLGMNSLVKWLAEQIADRAASASEESELRLERDENAVRIVTMHKSKGLEYPVVFCPFTWESTELRKNEVATFHDPEKEKRLTQDLGSEQLAKHEEMAKQEKLAEKLRLLYVALTRAKNRCYLVWGRFKGSESSAPNYLFQCPASEEKPGQDLTPEVFATIARGVAEGAGDVIGVAEMPEPTAAAYPAASPAHLTLLERSFHGVIERDWRIASFSSLTQNRTEELPDYDAMAGEEKLAVVPPSLSGIFAFPRGVKAGNCWHKILEEVDFQDESGFAEIVDNAFSQFGFSQEEFGGCVVETLRKMVSVPLILCQPDAGSTLAGKDGFTFSQIPPARRLCELEFHFPLAQVSPEILRRHFASHNQTPLGDHFPETMERLNFSPARGFLKGFIDLVFQHDGRFYIVDWKTNWLGGETAAYDPKAMQAEMRKHCYHLQYHLYAVALHRYLSLRLPGYDYDQHFGGVFYIFVRGVDPQQPERGVFRDRPSREMIVGLSELLGNT